MNNVPGVREMNGARDGFGVAGSAFRGKWAFLDNLRERLALDKFHREEVLAAMFPNVVDGDDVWMLEGAGGLGFGGETSDKRVAGEFAEEEGFDGNNAIEGNLARAKNDAHAAASDFFEQFIIADGSVSFRFFFFFRPLAGLSGKRKCAQADVDQTRGAKADRRVRRQRRRALSARFLSGHNEPFTCFRT